MTEFYESSLQVDKALALFLSKVLPLKRSDSPTFGSYEVFDYKTEEERLTIEYKGASDAIVSSELAGLFKNAVNWDCVGTLYNVHPNPTINSQIAPFVASFANPNFAQDISSGALMVPERSLVNLFSDLAGWDPKCSSGVFTFGGKGTNLYALRLALSRLQPNLRSEGLSVLPHTLSTDVGHPCHVEVGNWLGLGSSRCSRVKTKEGIVSPEQIGEELARLYEGGHKVACVFLSGVSTNQHAIDDVQGISHVVETVSSQFGQPKPWIHLDSVLGWVYLLLERYDFSVNPLGISDRTATILESKLNAMRGVKFADSFGVDFHKTGFVGYSSSLFMTRDRKALHSIETDYVEREEGLKFSDYSPYNFSLELSRPAHGPIGAWASLRTLGFEGYARILARQTEGYLRLKELMQSHPRIQVLNFNEQSNLLFISLLPTGVEAIDSTTDEVIVEATRNLNETFYRFVVKQYETGSSGLFFSASRSYLYQGMKLGAFKLYSFNSHFCEGSAVTIFSEFERLIDQFEDDPAGVEYFNWFEFLSLKTPKG